MKIFRDYSNYILYACISIATLQFWQIADMYEVSRSSNILFTLMCSFCHPIINESRSGGARDILTKRIERNLTIEQRILQSGNEMACSKNIQDVPYNGGSIC